jgi:hypothetical protein
LTRSVGDSNQTKRWCRVTVTAATTITIGLANTDSSASSAKK